MSYLNTLDINPLSNKLFANIFSPNFGKSRLTFHFLNGFLCFAKAICLFLLLFPFPEETDPQNIAKTNVKELTICFLLGVLWFKGLHLSD